MLLGLDKRFCWGFWPFFLVPGLVPGDHFHGDCAIASVSHQEQISARTDDLTNAVRSVVETFQSYRANHWPDPR